MHLLEKLYEIAEVNLIGKELSWDNFAEEFAATFDARLALYRPRMETEAMGILAKEEIIATNSAVMIKQYFEDKIYQASEGMLKNPEIPFEPVRRTDSLNDDEMRDLPFFGSFLKPHGIFHMMVVFAVLPDNTFLILLLWRDENQTDFSDMEKLRLALFMRLLAKVVGVFDTTVNQKHVSSVREFGDKYSLTESETGILAELLAGQSLREIAEQSGRTYGTVRWHVHNLLEKCNVKSQKNLLNEFYWLIKR